MIKKIYVDVFRGMKNGDLYQLVKIGNQTWFEKVKNPNAVNIGSIKTDKKAKSSRENGKKGGRPKKSAQEIFNDKAEKAKGNIVLD